MWDSINDAVKYQFMKKIIFFSLTFLLTVMGQAQEFSGGFRAGLNFSTFDGPLEMGPGGNALEEYSYTTGFHIGGVVNMRFNDYFGLRGEFSYSQRGAQYGFDGPSFWLFETTSQDELLVTGNRNVVLTVSNSYLTIPVSAFVRVGRFEFSGGAGVGLLLGGRGDGELRFSGTTSKGTPVEEFVTALDYNYSNDYFGRSDFREDVPVELDGIVVLAPLNIGAYYESQGGKKNLYKPLDLFVHGGLNFYLNRGLFIGGRLVYGLTDITRMVQDISFLGLDENNEFVKLDHKDRNITIEASIGFAF